MPAKRKQEASSSSSASLPELFSRLSLAVSSNDYDKVLDLAGQVLKSSPTDSRAAKEKITALIKLDRYKDALTFITESKFLNDKEIVLESAFCLYKTGKCAEAEELLKTASGRAADHIRAQNVSLLILGISLMIGVPDGGFRNSNEVVYRATEITRPNRP